MAWTDTVFKFLSFARYNSVTPSLVNGDASELQCDDEGRLLVNGERSNTVWLDSGASAAQRSVKASAGKLYQIFGRNVGATTKWFFLFNATAKPADGATGQMFCPIKVAAGEAFSIELPRSRSFSTGLYWVASSTDGSLTYDAAATFQVAVEYS